MVVDELVVASAAWHRKHHYHKCLHILPANHNLLCEWLDDR